MYDEVYQIPLYIEPEKTITEVKAILDKFQGDEDLITSIVEPYEFCDKGLVFVVDYYAKDYKKLISHIEKCGLHIDKERLSEMMD